MRRKPPFLALANISLTSPAAGDMDSDWVRQVTLDIGNKKLYNTFIKDIIPTLK